MRALIVGLGSIGRRHLANLRLIAPSTEITVWHQHSKVAAESDRDHADRIVFSLEDAVGAKPDVAIISSPAPLHVKTGIALAGAGSHLFIEKPISNSMDDVDSLLSLCRRHARLLMVGYNLRFYEPLLLVRQALREERIGRILTVRAEAGQYLPDWRPGQDYRKTVTARRDLGGGVLLELSHELDYVRWLIGEITSVGAQAARLGDLDIDVEDTVEITLRFANGAMGSIHLDMIQRPRTRGCRIVGTDGTIQLDLVSNSAQVFSARTAAWSWLHPARAIDYNDMYVAELRHYLQCVLTGEQPLVTGEDGRHVLQLALAVRQSAQEKRVVDL